MLISLKTTCKNSSSNIYCQLVSQIFHQIYYQNLPLQHSCDFFLCLLKASLLLKYNCNLNLDTLHVNIFHIQYLWYFRLCCESKFLDLKVFSQLWQGMAMPSIWYVSMCLLMLPFSLSFPHSLQLNIGFPFGILLSVLSIIGSVS